MSYSLYQPSGVVPARAYPLAALCLALTLPLAGLYAWLIHRLPAALNVFAACAFSFAMAGSVKRLCVTAKVRNPAWIGGAGILLGLCGWYVQWAAWTALHPDGGHGILGMWSSALASAARPSAIIGNAVDLAVSRSSAVAGLPLGYLAALMWLGELWMLLFLPQYMGKKQAEQVFDEQADRWADYVEPPGRFGPVDQPALIRAIMSPSERLSDLLAPVADRSASSCSKLRIYRCRGTDPLVSVMRVEARGPGKQERTVECARGLYLRVPAAELDELLAGKPAAAAGAGAGAGAGEEDPPELVNAINSLQAGHFQAAYDEAAAFVAADDLRLYCDANRICAIVCSQARQWTQACAYWQALFAREATAHNALQVATSAIMADRLEQGIAWGERASAMNASSREMPGIAIITTLVSALTEASHLKAALPYLGQLKAFYTDLHVTDPTFLFAHRMPLFHVFLEKNAAVVNKVLDVDESREWYASMLPHLDERGRAELNAWLEGASAQV